MTIVGACPKCGSPIYAPSVWNGITPPPSTHTCGCFAKAVGSVFTTTTIPWSVQRSSDGRWWTGNEWTAAKGREEQA